MNSELPLPTMETSRRLRNRWEVLCGQYLPLTADDSIWRYSRKPSGNDPSQGWKIHISVTVLTACDVLSAISPALQACGTMFKTPNSLDLLMRINSGIFYGYSQIGKIITIYPQNDREFVQTITLLAPLLRSWPTGPAVPYDLRYRKTCIYYRYGAFRPNRRTDANGSAFSSIISPAGAHVEDRRNALPDQIPWVRDPLASISKLATVRRCGPLNSRYVVYRALSQRGKGGVYECLDMHHDPPRACILKEGRRNGETTWDGRDGGSRVRNEYDVLKSLASQSTNVPKVYGRFRLNGNQYLVLEQIDGINLSSFIAKGVSKIPARLLFELCSQICSIVVSVHKMGWIWRDCKPSNFIVDMSGKVKAVDFEGACPVGRPDPMPWSTPFFTPPELSASNLSTVSSVREHDLYALGVCLSQLLGIKTRQKSGRTVLTKIWRGDIPEEVKDLISLLLSGKPLERPAANTAANTFGRLLS